MDCQSKRDRVLDLCRIQRCTHTARLLELHPINWNTRKKINAAFWRCFSLCAAAEIPPGSGLLKPSVTVRQNPYSFRGTNKSCQSSCLGNCFEVFLNVPRRSNLQTQPDARSNERPVAAVRQSPPKMSTCPSRFQDFLCYPISCFRGVGSRMLRWFEF